MSKRWLTPSRSLDPGPFPFTLSSCFFFCLFFFFFSSFSYFYFIFFILLFIVFFCIFSFFFFVMKNPQSIVRGVLDGKKTFPFPASQNNIPADRTLHFRWTAFSFPPTPASPRRSRSGVSSCPCPSSMTSCEGMHRPPSGVVVRDGLRASFQGQFVFDGPDWQPSCVLKWLPSFERYLALSDGRL